MITYNEPVILCWWEMGLNLIDTVSMQDTCFANLQRIQRRRERSWWTCSGSLGDRNKAYFFFSALWLTRMAEPKAPRPTCSMISYWSILDSMCSLSFPILCKWVQNNSLVQFLQPSSSSFTVRSWANLLLWGKVGTHLLISCNLSLFRSFCRCPGALDSWSWVAISLRHPADLSQGSHIWQAKLSTLVSLSHELGSTQWCHA